MKNTGITEAEILRRLRKIRPETHKWGDLTATAIFSEVFADQHRYCQTARSWFSYDANTGVWSIDKDGIRAAASLKALASALIKYAADADLPEETGAAFTKYCAEWKKANFRERILRDSRDRRYFQREDLDKDDYLLNCENGVLDLRPGGPKFMPHSPDLLISKKANVVYDPEAKAPRFERFLSEVMEGNSKGTGDLLLEYDSHGLIGKALEDKLLIEYGRTTRNGKSTHDGIISDLLGDYCLNISPETLASRQPDGRRASGDVARLCGARFVTCRESPKKMVLDAALIKAMTGRDTITARFLCEGEFQFQPKFNLSVNTNHLPQVNDPSVFKSGRIIVIPFNRHFEEWEQDKQLPDKLREEKSGILNMLIEALYRYYERGRFDIPDEVIAATQEYEQDSDKIQCFLDEKLTRKEGSCIPVSAAYPVYTTWATDNGFMPVSKSTFVESIKEKMLYRKTGTVNHVTVKNVIFGYDSFIRTDKTLEELTGE